MKLEPGVQLGDYRLLARIGSGAYGEVFEAEHVITGRRDALKLMAGELLHIPEEQQRFLREIRVQAALHHPNIAAVYNAFSTPHGLALVMELVQGKPLDTLLSRGPLPLSEGGDYVLGMLEGLAYAHEQGVVHRDIKPENVMVAPDGSVKLTDFGLARSMAAPRLTQTGAFAGSPCYMSPEQGLGLLEIDARSDTYSAGVVLYEVVTGKLPFRGKTTFEVMTEHQHSVPRPPRKWNPAIGPGLEKVILTALQKDPAHRFQSASAFRDALRSALLPVRRRPRRFPAAIWPAMAASCLFGVAGGYFTMRHRVARPIPPRAPVVQTTPVAVAVPEPPPPAEIEAPPPAEVEPAVAPPPPAPVRAKKSAPPAKGLRITGSVEVEPAPPTRPVIREIERPHGLPPVPVESKPAPETVPAAPVPPPEAETSAPSSASSSEAKPETASSAAEKKRNVVVRTFQRLLHGRPKVPPGKQQ